MKAICDSEGIERYKVSEAIYNFCKITAQKLRKDDTQIIGIFCGKKGSGKSVLAQYWGNIIDPTLEGNISRICMRNDTFKEQIVNNKEKTVIADEGVSILYKRNVMTKEGRDIKEFFEKIRCFNNCILICVPNLIDLDRDLLLSEDDINFVVSVWEDKTPEGQIKGNCRAYINLKGNPIATNFIKYRLGKRGVHGFRRSRKPPFAFQQKGSKVNKDIWLPVGNDEYRKLKIDDAKDYVKPKKKIEKKKEERPSTIKKRIVQKIIYEAKKKNPNLTDKTIAEVLGYTREHVTALKNEAVEVFGGDKVGYNGENVDGRAAKEGRGSN